MTRYQDLEKTPLERRTLLAVLLEALEVSPDKVAVVDAIRQLTYGELWEESCRTAGGLQALGIRCEERVVLLLENHVDSVVAWIALCMIGAVEVPINTSYMGEMLAYVIDDSGAGVAIVDASFLPNLADIVHDVRRLSRAIVRGDFESIDVAAFSVNSVALVPFGDLARHDSVVPVDVAPWDLAAVIYTSGTTGRSKGVLAPQAHAWNHASAVGSTEAEDVRFVVLPQFHIAGQWGGVYRSLIAGATAYVASGFHVSTFWEEIRSVRATTTQLVGTMASFLTAPDPSPSDADNPLREIHMIPVVSDVEGFAKRFGVSIVTAFGNTEVGTVLMNPDAVEYPGVGKVRPGYEAMIVDEHDIEVPRGRPGELVIRAAVPWTTMIGYQGEPEKTAEAYRNGWLHGGDALYQVDEGSFFFVDRMDDSIRRRGENVSSLEVELHLNQHPAVVESAAVAVPSEHLEDEIKAVVVLIGDSDVDEEELFRFMAERLPYFMVPRFIEILPELPKTPTSKVRKVELRTRDSGSVWDSTAAGLVVTRDGSVVMASTP
jgi:crotonobetaine/carnitine-CoA ligase